jgi:thioredoxin-dependent peroxiredoxin
MAHPKIGNLAPAFVLPDQNGDPHALKEYRGGIVLLYFYPKALTPGCTVQACGLRDSSKALAKPGVTVFGISADPQKLLQKFAAKEKLNFTLLSDIDHEVADKYGVWGPKQFMGRTYDGLHRTSFIIDRDGRLRHVIEKVNTRTHHDEVLAWIGANLK